MIKSDQRQYGPLFETIDPTRCALLGDSLQNFFMTTGFPMHNPGASRIAPNVNRLAKAVRTAGGRIIWLQHTVSAGGQQAIPRWQTDLEPSRYASMEEHLRPGVPGHDLARAIETDESDLRLEKYRVSAFFPNSSSLDQRLRQLGVRTLIIAGAQTNIGCEQNARDAVMLDYRVIFITDATAASTEEAHEATLRTLGAMLVDVRPTQDAIALISAGGAGM